MLEGDECHEMLEGDEGFGVLGDEGDEGHEVLDGNAATCSTAMEAADCPQATECSKDVRKMPPTSQLKRLAEVPVLPTDGTTPLGMATRSSTCFDSKGGNEDIGRVGHWCYDGAMMFASRPRDNKIELVTPVPPTQKRIAGMFLSRPRRNGSQVCVCVWYLRVLCPSARLSARFYHPHCASRIPPVTQSAMLARNDFRLNSQEEQWSAGRQ